MSFHFYAPEYPLNRYVRYFYTPKGAMPYGAEKVMPSAQTDLKLNFGAPFLAKRQGEPDYDGVDAEGWFMGVWDQYHTVKWPKDPDFVGVSFWPGGAHALLGINIGDTYNQLIPLDAIWGGFACTLRQRLGDLTDPQARFVLLEQLLTERVHFTVQFEKIAGALQTLRTGSIRTQVGKLGPLPDFTPKHLITLFNRVVGVSPKRLARLHRLQNVMEAINQARPVSWAAVSHDFLFADQAHFNKEFKGFTGHTPSDYLNMRTRVSNETPDHACYIRLLPITS